MTSVNRAYENRVHLIVYADYVRLGEKLRPILHQIELEGHLEIYCSINKLATRLRQTGPGNIIAVLLTTHRRELIKIAGLSDLLRDIKMILVLPDRGHDTIAIGHGLFPRFISYADGDLQDVGAVLGRMIAQRQIINN